MNPKSIFAIYGSPNVGKSETIRLIFDLLRTNYPTAKITLIHATHGVDISVLVEIKGTKIGLESQGDPNSRLPDTLKHFQKISCDIMVCATRNWGGTVNAVNSLAPIYSIIWHQKKSEPIVKLQSRRNKVAARIIFNQIKKLV